MKKIYYFFVLILVSTISFYSCNDNTTYAQELKAEKNLIKDYIKRNNIKVWSSFPKDDVWPENVYVLTSTGLYFRLESKGKSNTDSITLQTGNLVIPRYKQYTLGIPSDSVYNWSTIDNAYADKSFIYGNPNQTCVAFHEAVSYMKYNESVAKIIVTSKMGFKENWTPATPMLYYLKIKIQK